MIAASEKTLYQDPSGIVVSTSRVILNQTTYALSNITSVRCEKRSPSYGPWVFFGLFGLILAMFEGSRMLGFVILAACILAFILLKPTFRLILGSASGERTALESKQPAYIVKIVAAINDAIVARG